MPSSNVEPPAGAAPHGPASLPNHRAPAAGAEPPIDAALPTAPAHPRARRPRRISPTRRLFLRTINAQVASARVLALTALLVLLAGSVLWITGTAGSPVLALYFLALAAVLAVAVYWFIQVMNMFRGR